MRKTLLILSLLSIFFGVECLAATLGEPENLYYAKARLTRYYKSGGYNNDISKIMSTAQDYLAAKLKKADPRKSKLAVVLDIDETAISNYPRMLETGYGGSKKDIDLGLKEGDDPVIVPTLNLFQFAKAHNVAVFFVTGRDEKLREPTIRNLNSVGYKNWDGLYMRHTAYNTIYKSIIPFKVNARKLLTSKGYHIVLNIGDQKSDLAGGYAEKSYKLPNPFYYLP